VAATDDDVANLETALAARAANPSLRLVLRLFDPDLSALVGRTLGLGQAWSVSALAAPAFAAAAFGPSVVAAIPVGDRALLVAELEVTAGGPLDGRDAAALERELELRFLWRPDAPLRAGERHAVAATRSALRQVS
jgi:hypothetical protein